MSTIATERTMRNRRLRIAATAIVVTIAAPILLVVFIGRMMGERR